MTNPFCVHIAPVDKKFMRPYVGFVEKHFGLENQSFIFLPYDRETDFSNLPRSRIVHTPSQMLKSLPLLYQADRIILHSIMSKKQVMFLALQPWLLKKCCWIMWGSDLYAYQNPRDTISKRFLEFLRRFIFRRMGYVNTGTRGDYDLFQKWYGGRAQWIKSFNYTSNIIPEISVPKRKKGDPLRIVVGNSAAASNRHEKLFALLEPFQDRTIEVHCPLSYGDHNYEQERDRIIATGRKIFGDSFFPLTDFMTQSDYSQWLAQFDFGLYGHQRQQGFGNILSLLSMGKTVYMDPASSLHTVFDQYGLIVKDIDHFDCEELSDDDKQKNRQNVRTGFSEESLVKSLSQLLT